MKYFIYWWGGGGRGVVQGMLEIYISIWRRRTTPQIKLKIIKIRSGCAAPHSFHFHFPYFLNREEQSMYRRHTFRERRPCTTACPGCRRRWGHINWNSVRWGKFFFLADQSSLGLIKVPCTDTTSPTNHPRKDPFHMYSLSPHSPQFQQSAGSIPLWSLWYRP